MPSTDRVGAHPDATDTPAWRHEAARHVPRLLGARRVHAASACVRLPGPSAIFRSSEKRSPWLGRVCPERGSRASPERTGAPAFLGLTSRSDTRQTTGDPCVKPIRRALAWLRSPRRAEPEMPPKRRRQGAPRFGGPREHAPRMHAKRTRTWGHDPGERCVRKGVAGRSGATSQLAQRAKKMALLQGPSGHPKEGWQRGSRRKERRKNEGGRQRARTTERFGTLLAMRTVGAEVCSARFARHTLKFVPSDMRESFVAPNA